MKKFYRGSYIDASCQVWLHLAKQFQREDIFNISQSETRIWPYLLAEWNEMKKLYRGSYIDAFCQVWFHLAQLFHQSRLKYEKVIGRTTDAKWWQYLTWPFGSGELKRKKSRRGRRTTIRKKEMHPEIKESLKLSDKLRWWQCLLLGTFGIFFFPLFDDFIFNFFYYFKIWVNSQNFSLRTSLFLFRGVIQL